MRPRWTLAQTLLVTGILGTGAGLVARSPRSWMHLVESLIPAVVVFVALPTLIVFACRWVARQPLQYRLAIESVTLLALLGLSAVTWNPYTGQERQCWELAHSAHVARASTPAARRDLDREADWFRQRASALRWRGLWLGLTLGPRVRDMAVWGRTGLNYELGTMESIERHEATLRRLTAPGP